jgi:PiT family inorganic phosphate transporter
VEELVWLVALVAIALVFDFTNGFHDAANAIATSVSTRALTPRTALLMAASLNLLGALASTKVAATVGKGIIDPPTGMEGLIVVFAALVGAITWNMITWYFGLPSSSSHALIGGLVGAALASGALVKWAGVIDKVVLPMVLSPIIGVGLGYLVMVGILWAVRNGRPGRLNRNFRKLQTLSAAVMSYSHGTQDAQKTMGIIVLGLLVTGYLPAGEFTVPLWVVLSAAVAISLGTYAGGWRIMRTLGRRVIKLDPARGFAAETTASTVLLSAASLGMPLSTTHIITTSIMGVGATRRLSAVRWGVAGNIVVAWIMTIPAAAGVAALAYFVIRIFA